MWERKAAFCMQAVCWAYGGMADWSLIVCGGDVGDWCNAGRAAGSRSHTEQGLCSHNNRSAQTGSATPALRELCAHSFSSKEQFFPSLSHIFSSVHLHIPVYLSTEESCLTVSDRLTNSKEKKLWPIVTAVMSHTSVCVCKGQCTGYEHYPTQRGLPKVVPVYSWGGMCWLDDD